MFIPIIGFTTPVVRTRDEKIRYIKAMTLAIILDFVIYYNIVLWAIQ